MKNSEKSLYVSRQTDDKPEIFHSIQGEGISSGTPAVFLRLALCNLKCTWCDTKYAWDWEHYDQKKEVIGISISEIEESIFSFGCKHLVVTGGEPLVQQNGLSKLLVDLKGKGFYIEIETNGTIIPKDNCVDLVNQWNVSPKLGNSGNPRHLREISNAYAFFTYLSSSYFKYIIQTEHDLNEVQSLTEKYEIPKERVILMPEATNSETLIRRSRWLTKICQDKGYKFSTRLHILLWGNKRGV
jgi:7-carboxy-7-deazaguanine synthase